MISCDGSEHAQLLQICCSLHADFLALCAKMMLEKMTSLSSGIESSAPKLSYEDAQLQDANFDINNISYGGYLTDLFYFC